MTVNLKDGQVAALVNELRDIALRFHGAGQLRERIAQVIRPLFLQSKEGYKTDEWTAWQSMETAPQTGQAILVWCPENSNIFEVCWGEDDGWVYFGPFNQRLCDEPTRWMPLPPPPTKEPQ